MEVSVIIPCKNLSAYIERCLGSVLQQNFDKNQFEIIVILDSCTDNSGEIVRNVLAHRPHDKILETDFSNPGAARNAGLDCATGNYVWMIDGDDYIADINAFRILTALIRKTKTAAVYMTEFQSDKPVHDDFAAWRYFYDRKFIGNTRFGFELLNEDWNFTQKLCAKPNYTETRTDGKMYHYTYPRQGSITDNVRSMLEQQMKNNKTQGEKQ